MCCPRNPAQAAAGFGGTAGGGRKEKSLYRFEIAHFAEEKRARRTLISGGFPGIFGMVKGGLPAKSAHFRAQSHTKAVARRAVHA
jgi:hypothetical protein